MTQHLEIFRALAEPFERDEVRTRSQGGRQLQYITARTVMNRLDDVLGPANWWDEYHPGEHSVICRLTIRLPDGTTLMKCDAGGYAGMADHGDDDKSGFSDAFKRAAVKFGVGRYLYRDGVAKLSGPVERPTERPAAAKPYPVYEAWLDQCCEYVNRQWLESLPRNGNAKAPAEIMVKFQLNRHLLKALGRRDSITNIEASNIKVGAESWKVDPEAMLAEARVYCHRKLADAKADLDGKRKPAREPGGDDGPSEDEHAVLDELTAGTGAANA